MQENIECIRYIRPTYPWDMPELVEHDNLYGITIVYTLDYNTRRVSAKFSVCHEDNFNKDFGKFMARNSGVTHYFWLEDIRLFGDLNKASIASLCKKYNRPYSTRFVNLLKLFRRAAMVVK